MQNFERVTVDQNTHTHTHTHTHTVCAHMQRTCSTHARAHTDIHTHMHTLLLCSYHLMYIHIVSIQNNFSINRLANGSSIMPAIIGTTIYNLCAVIVNDEYTMSVNFFIRVSLRVYIIVAKSM